MKSLSQFNLVLIIGIGSQLLSACSSFKGVESNENLKKLEYGMTQSKVLYLLGTPDSVRDVGTKDTRWVYEFKRDDKKGHNLFIDFHDGGLAKTGELSGREIASEENRYNGSCTKNVHRAVFEESRCIK